MIGGEVFLYNGWEKLSAYLTRKGVAVNIVSNGYRIDRREMEQIRRSGVINVGISLDGMVANHNRIRGRRDAFQRVAMMLRLDHHPDKSSFFPLRNVSNASITTPVTVFPFSLAYLSTRSDSWHGTWIVSS
jgi:MoaA/NifB/PqqE/SkfB family radical SAM enzyme